jgi:membrane dipeptidase
MSPSYQSARETALSLLQPTPAQLEHGLALHHASLVIESYGFAPRAVVDEKPLIAAAEAGATAYEIEQLSGEMAMLDMVADSEQQRAFAEAFDFAGVTCIFQNAGEENNDIETLLRRLGRFTHAADAMPDILRRATTPDDILVVHREKKHCLYLSANGVPLPSQFRNTAEGVNFIRTFFQLGIRMMHLTYNRRNLIGDGCGESTDGGLSEFGRAVVEEMNRVGVIVDIAHSGIQTGLDAARCSQKPIVISHAICAALSDHCRAKPDELIRAVAETGGLIGICCIPYFLQGSGDINAFLDHIDHAVKLVGADHVAIGTDVAAQLGSPPSSRSDKLPRSRTRFEALWPPRDAARDAQWLKPQQRDSLAWTNWPLFTVGMAARGYRDEDIQKIIGGNILRVARAALPGNA